jgi:enoyl-CoA hydratase/carnithine racemase
VAYDNYPELEISFDGHVGILAMNQPERLNPISPATTEIQIRDALREMENDTNVRIVVFTGNGKSFSAGADQGGPNAPKPDARLATQEGMGSQAGRLLYGPIPGGPSIADGSMWLYLHKFKKPMIGAVKGYALGGGWELAEACDLVVAGESAKLGAIEIKLGLFPFGLGSQYLARTVGKHRALEIMMTGDLIDAQTALDWGLVNKVVPDDECLSTAVAWAHELCKHAPIPLGMIKYLTNKALAIEEHYDLERAFAYHLMGTQDTATARDWWAEHRGAPDAPAPEFKMR